MKLKTERRESTDNSFVLDGWKDQFVHDTAVAHALLSAIEDVKQQNDALTATDAMWYVEKRAGEILAGWGYRDGGG